MHYANGRAAKAGDVVRGKGYNIKHEIIGLLVFATPGASSCNCQVATVTQKSLVYVVAVPRRVSQDGGQPAECFFSLLPTSQVHVVPTIEYGQLDAFVAIDPNTGDVLPPEEGQ